MALNDQSRWPGCRVTIKGAQEQVFNIAQPPGPDRFAVAEVEELQAIEVVVADNKGDEIGWEMRAKPRVPAEYIVIGANKIVFRPNTPITATRWPRQHSNLRTLLRAGELA